MYAENTPYYKDLTAPESAVCVCYFSKYVIYIIYSYNNIVKYFLFAAQGKQTRLFTKAKTPETERFTVLFSQAFCFFYCVVYVVANSVCNGVVFHGDASLFLAVFFYNEESNLNLIFAENALLLNNVYLV